MTPHWHEHNPWRDEIFYAPLELLAKCVAGGTVFISSTGETLPYDVPYILNQWGRAGDRLDGYILPQPHGRHSIGVRYGAEGSQYLSPHNSNPEITEALLHFLRISA